MNIAHGTHQLGEDLLHLADFHAAMVENVVVQLIARTVFQHQPDQVLGHNHLVQSRDVRVQELAMVVDFSGQVGIVLFRALQHHFRAVRQLVRGQVDFAEAAFSDEAAEGIVADGVQFGGGEFAEEGLVGVG
jgi:hypothetical protein